MAIFLDNASTTKPDKEVIKEMNTALDDFYGNPSSTHSIGRKVKAKLENAKHKIAKLINCNSSDIIFTSGGTESNNQILYSNIIWGNIKTVITSRIEHQSVLETLIKLKEKNNFELIYLNLDENGCIDYTELEIKLNQNTHVLVSLMHGNNEIGNLLNLNLVAKLCEKYNALFHTDCSQTLGFYELDFKNSSIDFASFSAHKLHGPKGVGFIYAKNKKNIHSFIFGGNQQAGLRSGTENLPAILGLTKSIEIAYNNLLKDKTHIVSLKNYAIREIKKIFPTIIFNGNCLEDESKNHYKILSILLPFKNNLIGFQLDLKGICISQGSACSSGSSKTSHVIKELNNNLENTTPIRISFSKNNNTTDIDALINALKEVI